MQRPRAASPREQRVRLPRRQGAAGPRAARFTTNNRGGGRAGRRPLRYASTGRARAHSCLARPDVEATPCAALRADSPRPQQGDAVNTAARMEAASRPGAVVLHRSSVRQWLREQPPGPGPASHAPALPTPPVAVPAMLRVQCKGKGPQPAAVFDCGRRCFAAAQELPLPGPPEAQPDGDGGDGAASSGCGGRGAADDRRDDGRNQAHGQQQRGVYGAGTGTGWRAWESWGGRPAPTLHRRLHSASEVLDGQVFLLNAATASGNGRVSPVRPESRYEA